MKCLLLLFLMLLLINCSGLRKVAYTPVKMLENNYLPDATLEIIPELESALARGGGFEDAGIIVRASLLTKSSIYWAECKKYLTARYQNGHRAADSCDLSNQKFLGVLNEKIEKYFDRATCFDIQVTSREKKLNKQSPWKITYSSEGVRGAMQLIPFSLKEKLVDNLFYNGGWAQIMQKTFGTIACSPKKLDITKPIYMNIQPRFEMGIKSMWLGWLVKGSFTKMPRLSLVEEQHQKYKSFDKYRKKKSKNY